jgi:hypothetical protein
MTATEIPRCPPPLFELWRARTLGMTRRNPAMSGKMAAEDDCERVLSRGPYSPQSIRIFPVFSFLFMRVNASAAREGG